MVYKQDITDCFADKIGGSGLLRDEFSANLKKVISAKSGIKKYQNGAVLPLLAAVKKPENIELLKQVANKIREGFTSLVILGTGGSTLNPQSVVALRQDVNPDFKIYFVDNIDPYFMDNLFSGIDLHKTAFLAISKSGGTIEVVAQLLLAIAKVEDAGINNIGRHFFIITEPTNNNLCKIGEQIGATILNHDIDIGGRFSTFTNVGLLPAIVAGLDADLFCKGASGVVDDFFAGDDNYPLQGAAMALTAMDSGLCISVFMPYFEALKPFSSWICQVWAESLGKNGHGSTPLKVVGTLDQHSQLQLYLDGPKDKIFSIFGVKNKKSGPSINSRFTSLPGLGDVEGKTIAEINMAALGGTAASLAEMGRPVRMFDMNKLNEESLGALMMHFALETILVAQVLNINAFDQPAVEAGKVLSRKMLAKKE